MIEAAAHVHISASRDEIFEVVADLAARVAFSDHYIQEFRLTTPRTARAGAGARYRVDAPLFTHYAETWIAEVDPPRFVREEGRAGRSGKIRMGTSWELSKQGSGLTRVDLLTWMDGGTPRDQLRQRLGLGSWLKRQNKTALERLRMIFEEPSSEPLARATIAGYEPEKAARFGG